MKIELRFPDGPPTSQTSLPGSVHPTRPGSAGTANGHYFSDPDPLLEEILNEDYSEEMVCSNYYSFLLIKSTYKSKTEIQKYKFKIGIKLN
ncbi:unnamed protein product [Haemonchus placei]|uniref:DIX domain-containing protein n=1 Tax=Haemonchus placei TaxID=6290 RepID=A0A0N4WYS9_HAEPC|nr:unnamed protein product [Haemonchus placei]